MEPETATIQPPVNIQHGNIQHGNIRPRNPIRRPPDRIPGVEVYLKGSCLTNPGPGGYAGVILQPGGRWTVQSAAHPDLTNNQAEIRATILALESIPEPSLITVYSNSLYLVSQGNEVWSVSTNLALWKKLVNLLQVHQATFVHIPKAQAHPLIELAAQQARARAIQLTAQTDLHPEIQSKTQNLEEIPTTKPGNKTGKRPARSGRPTRKSPGSTPSLATAP